MLNPALDLLTDYPFQRLRDLLADVTPPDGLAPLLMSIGEPQHPPPPMLAEKLTETAAGWGKYPPLEGTPEWGAAVAAWLERRYGLTPAAIDPARHILPVTGTREALFMVGLVAIPDAKNGRKPLALMPNPFYPVYSGAALIGGAEPVFMPATRETGFQPDLDAVSADVLDRTSLMYLCSPGNPQGSVADLAYLKKAIGLARAHNFVLVVDECYAEIYGDKPPPGGLQACAALGDGFDNVLVFHSLSKRSNAPGLRSGFMAGDPAIIAAFSRLRSYSAASLGLPVLAASAALWRDEAHVEENRALYRAKFDLAERLLGDRLGFTRPDGGFFMWLDVGDGEAATRKLWGEGAVRVLPGRYLSRGGANGDNPGAAYIRVALVHDLATTEEALTRIVKVLC
ncbi:MAG: aminotransferase class I/II-fold pyridoxal phosphate-dependent enzyme [Rhodospirillales bacterium]|nr:aminotransferase class I/II-fold pyridoxal phosphate-dependent enzyme [Rhodospirillales bacterium]